jgi:DNA repair protein RecO (recombination protein O)
LAVRVHKTRGIVLRTVKYGETSAIITIHTELFGLQSYLINGIRTTSKKGPGKANLFQPAAILDLIVYHNELKNLQRVKEFKWGYLYQHLFFDVIKNAVALFMVELLQKCLKQPESNAELYHFIEDAFIHLDGSQETAVANYPLFFALNLANFFGFRIHDDHSAKRQWLDLQEGVFVAEQPQHQHYLDDEYSNITSKLLKVMQPHELEQIKLNQDTRRILLQAYQHFYALHVPDFGTMRTLPVLQAVLE